MIFSLRWFSFAAPVVVGLLLAGDAKAQDKAWVSLFDGKTIDGWEKVGHKNSIWEVKDGALCGSGPASMLVCADYSRRPELRSLLARKPGLSCQTPFEAFARFRQATYATSFRPT